MVRISDRAASELRQLLESRGAGPTTGLRLAVTKGGCAGWQYEMKIAEAEEGDEIHEFDGGRLVVAADSIDRLDGCRIDYRDALSDSGFRVENPRAARSCGCGTSFEETDQALGPGEIEECS